MPFKKICQELNFVNHCKKYNLTLWQCPSFLAVVTGFITVLTMITTYFIATIFSSEPETVALIVLIITTILIVIDYFIIKGFDQLATANQMKTEFVSIASHQLRTPLSIVKWSINLINRKKELSEEQTEQLKIIEESNQRMINLVNDLLSISRIEQNRLGLKPEKIEMFELTKELINEYQPIARASNIKLTFKTGDQIVFAWVDPQKIKLAFGNLIDNAIKYTMGGGIVEIKLSKLDKRVRCEIKDSGVGIPEKEKRQIFQKFFRSQNVMKYQTKGTGLGLFIAKAIIEGSKGKIGFWSKEGKGSVFWFEIPIKS